ncbi:MAG: hypothetical protein ACE14L_15705 [Terriglobales bacterium]
MTPPSSTSKNVTEVFYAELAAGTPTSLPLATFIMAAARYNRKQHETETAFRTALFDFVRLVKGHPEVASLNAVDATNAFGRMLSDLSNRNVLDAWAHFFDYSDDPRVEFWDTWAKVRVPLGFDVVRRACANAQELPLVPASNLSDSYARFISVVGHLQRELLDRNILVPCKTFAGVLNLGTITISRYRSAAVAFHLLTKVKDGRYTEREADEFRFHCELFDWQTGRQVRKP